MLLGGCLLDPVLGAAKLLVDLFEALFGNLKFAPKGLALVADDLQLFRKRTPQRRKFLPHS